MQCTGCGSQIEIYFRAKTANAINNRCRETDLYKLAGRTTLKARCVPEATKKKRKNFRKRIKWMAEDGEALKVVHLVILHFY
jgi:hypothetical protein